MKNIRLVFILTILFLSLFSFNSHAQKASYINDLEEFIESRIKEIASSDVVLRRVQEQNIENEDMTSSEMKVLEGKWTSERRKKVRPLSKKVEEAPLSIYLKSIQEESNGLFTDIVVTDANGVTVGQSIISENYWFGQNIAWQKTFQARSYTPYMSDLYFNNHTNLFQVDVAIMIIHEDDPIGMFYAGIDVERLK